MSNDAYGTPASLSWMKNRAAARAGSFYLSVHRFFPWLGTYYQHANRLAVLHFLVNQAEVPARLLNVYFVGDRFRDGTECPATEDHWRSLIEARRLTLGYPNTTY